MASFQTNMKEWDGAYAPPSTIKTQKSDPWGELAAKLIPGAIDAVGKGYAEAKGANILGTSTSAEEAQRGVEAFANDVPFTDDASNTPDQKARIDDMKREALAKYGTNDKKIQALVSAGKITSLEANARRHQLIQENLSNPVLAMFKEDFMEASTAFTGGPGLTEQYFGAYMPTEEERVQLAMQDQAIKEQAKFQADVKSTALVFGISEEAAKKQIKAQAERAQYLASKEEEFKLRNFTSQESYAVAIANIDQITNTISTQLGALVANGKKFDDPATLIGQLEQARAVGVTKIAQYTQKMTREDRNAAESTLNSRIDGLIDMVGSADGHDYFMKSIQRIKGGVEANEARMTQRLMDVAGPLWIVHKHAPEMAKLIQGAAAGDKAAEFGFKTDPLAQSWAKGLGIVIDPIENAETAAGIVNGNTKFSMSKALNFVSSLWSNGDQGAKAEEELAVKQPDVHTSLLQTAFKAAGEEDKSPLSNYSTSQEWIVRSRTPDGAKTVANAIRARVADARVRQFGQMGKIPTGEIVVRPAQVKSTGGYWAPGMTNVPAFEFHTPGISPSVQKDMIQVIRIMENSPLVMKELGVKSSDEYLQKFFLEK